MSHIKRAAQTQYNRCFISLDTVLDEVNNRWPSVLLLLDLTLRDFPVCYYR